MYNMYGYIDAISMSIRIRQGWANFWRWVTRSQIAVFQPLRDSIVNNVIPFEIRGEAIKRTDDLKVLGRTGTSRSFTVHPDNVKIIEEKNAQRFSERLLQTEDGVIGVLYLASHEEPSTLRFHANGPTCSQNHYQTDKKGIIIEETAGGES